MQRTTIRAITDAVVEGRRIDAHQALELYENAELSTLAFLADSTRRRLHPEPLVTYVVDRNINPTNICGTRCAFCAFHRPPGHPEGYVLERETIFAKVQELVELGGTVVLMQSGNHPELGLDWHAELMRSLKARFPVHLHAMSPPEIHHLARLEGLSCEVVLSRLIEAGMDSMPGGGAEILVDRVRALISPCKCSADEWLEAMRMAHQLGIRTTATMMFGHVETPAERIDHLLRLRELQDETGGFTAFACWNFQRANTTLDAPMSTHGEYFRTLALARVVLDNFASIQTSFVTQGIRAAQISLRLGANDFGGGMMEENVVSAAGCHHLESIAEMERHIRAAGFEPRQRDFFYNLVDERPVPEEDLAARTRWCDGS